MTYIAQKGKQKRKLISMEMAHGGIAANKGLSRGISGGRKTSDQSGANQGQFKLTDYSKVATFSTSFLIIFSLRKVRQRFRILYTELSSSCTFYPSRCINYRHLFLSLSVEQMHIISLPLSLSLENYIHLCKILILIFSLSLFGALCRFFLSLSKAL